MFWCPPGVQAQISGHRKNKPKKLAEMIPRGAVGEQIRGHQAGRGWGRKLVGTATAGPGGAQIGRHRPNPPRYPPNIFPCSPISVPSRFVHPAPPPPSGPWRPSPPALSAPLVLTVPYRDRCHYYRNSCDDMLARKKENLPQNTN